MPGGLLKTLFAIGSFVRVFQLYVIILETLGNFGLNIIAITSLSFTFFLVLLFLKSIKPYRYLPLPHFCCFFYSVALPQICPTSFSDSHFYYTLRVNLKLESMGLS
jgi:hypothetical protein